MHLDLGLGLEINKVQQASDSTPADALLDENGAAILDENNAFILEG